MPPALQICFHLAIVDQLGPGGSVVYGYDKLDRLNFTLIQSGSAAGSTSYSYTAGTNRLAAVNDASGARTIAYDARGNTASEVRPGGIAAATAYDGYGRLTSYSRSDAGAYAFAYNGLDDRVTMDLPTGTRRFVYDAGGRVMGEYGASAADVKAEFIWLSPEVGAGGAFGGDDGLGGYMPLAVATPDSGGTIQLNWVHGNHLGVPLITTDAAGNTATTPNDYLAPGFPGQSRVIADIYYNRYRDYNPSTGRYIQADPIGLEGGSNPYGYAEANPISFMDPEGRSTMPLPLPLPPALIPAGVRALPGIALDFCIVNPIACGVGAGIVIGGIWLYKHWCLNAIEQTWEDQVSYMAKGGRQNKHNEYSDRARHESPQDPCKWLRDEYNNTPPGLERNKIKESMKAFGCTWNSTLK